MHDNLITTENVMWMNFVLSSFRVYGDHTGETVGGATTVATPTSKDPTALAWLADWPTG